MQMSENGPATAALWRNRHSNPDEPCGHWRCAEGDGYQCDSCGHYWALGSGTHYVDGQFLCRSCRWMHGA